MMICPKKEKKNSGQALIVILLVSAVGLTLGLSLASRATEDTNITTEIEESTRAFSAAEAGLEESARHIGEITAPGSSYKGSLGSAKYEVAVKDAGGTKEPYQFPGKVKNNQNITVWLVGHKGDEVDLADEYAADGIDICWGKEGEDYAGLELAFHYKRPDADAILLPDGTKTTYMIARGAFDAPDAPHDLIASAPNAKIASSGDCGGEYRYKVKLNFENMDSNNPYRFGTDTPLFLKIRPIIVDGNGDSDLNTRLAIAPQNGAELKTQGEEHISTGTTDSGQTTKLVQFISHPIPPEIFDFVLYSKSGIER